MIEGVLDIRREILLEFKGSSEGCISSSFGVPRNGPGIGSAAKALDGISNDLAVETFSCLGI